MKQWLDNNWISLLIQIGVILVSCSICYATLNTKVAYIEKEQKVLKTDHDVLISVSVKIDRLTEDIRELKSEVKEIKAKLK